eukprot:937165-Rhodomonas_salina.1
MAVCTRMISTLAVVEHDDDEDGGGGGWRRRMETVRRMGMLVSAGAMACSVKDRACGGRGMFGG